MSTRELSDKSFKEAILDNNGVAFVDFFAEWCLPCKEMSETVSQLGEEADGKYIVAKVNVDENPRLSSEYAVTSIPTIIIFKNGKEISRTVGVNSKEYYQDILDNITKLV